MLDMLISNARIIDGTGNPWYRGNVAIHYGHITSLHSAETEAATVIDATNLCCTPGFIDPHAHDEGYAFFDEATHAKMSQGVTTSVSGNCGLSLAPINPRYLSDFTKAMSLLAQPAELATFTSFNAFLCAQEKKPHGINHAFMVGHGALRIAVSGLENRPVTAQELDTMQGLLREALESGAVGMSIGMLYPPGNIASQEEFVSLCRILQEHDRILTIHIRDEASQVVESVAEAIEIARLSGVSINISHHKALGVTNWGKVKTSLALIEKANDEGLEVGFDQYPYNANCTGLNTVLPPSVLLGNQAQLCKQLATPEFRKKMLHDIMHPTECWDNYGLNVGMERTLIIKADATPEAVGMRVADYAAQKGIDPMDAAFDLLVANSLDVVAVYFSISDDDMATLMHSVYGMFGSDGVFLPNGQKTHPRIMGTMPRVYKHYVRELGVLGMEEAVRKMTSLPARRMRLGQRGLLLPGYIADITLFDPHAIGDTADFIKDSYAPNTGIQHVIVNGALAMQDNHYTGAASGRVWRGC